MKKIETKKLLMPFFIIIISFLFIVESILNKSITNKIIMISIIISTIYLFFKNKFNKKNFLLTILLVLFFNAFVLEKFLNNSTSETTYIIFIFFEIILFPYCLFVLLNCPKNKKTSDKLIVIISILFTILYLLQYILSANFISKDIFIFFLIILKFMLLKTDKKVINLLFDLLLFGIGITTNSIILSIVIILFNLKALYKNIKTKKFLILYIAFLAIMLICTGLWIYNNLSYEDKIENFISSYEFPTNNNNEINELVQLFNNRNLNEKLFGTSSVLNTNNFIISNSSFVYFYFYLGVLGFIIYILNILFYLKIIFKNNNRKFEMTILLIYSFISSILLIPFTYLILSYVLTNDCTSDYVKDKINKIKTILLILIILLISILLLFTLNKNKSNEEILTIIPNEKLEISGNYDLTLIESKTIKDLEIEENLYYYQLSNKKEMLAYITYGIREIDDVTFKFITIENRQNNLNIDIEISNSNLECLQNFESYNIERDYSNIVGINKLKLPIGYFSDSNKEYIVSRTFKYNKLVKDYGNGNKSTIYELISQDDDLKNNKKTITIEPNINTDIYIIESNKKLLNDEESIIEYINLTNNNSSWYTFYGNYYKIQYSIDPFTREGYGKNLGRLIEEDAYELSKSNNSIIFSALSKSAIFSLYHHTAINTENNLWLTNYTSTWLSKDYGITAYYIDTRFNETIGYLLLNLYDETNNEKFLTSFLNYADFIVSSWEKESYLVKSNRILPDYFSNNHTIKTHSSFNHQLALINYLFKAYEITENNDYYDTAKAILNGLIGFGDEWIRDNNDLWYEVNSDGEFSGKDYATVTLDDLLHTQRYLYQFDKELNAQLTKYIKSKLAYLESENISIPSSTLSLIEEYVE